MDIRIPWYTHAYLHIQLHRYTDTQIHRYTDTQIHRYTNTDTRSPMHELTRAYSAYSHAFMFSRVLNMPDAQVRIKRFEGPTRADYFWPANFPRARRESPSSLTRDSRPCGTPTARNRACADAFTGSQREAAVPKSRQRAEAVRKVLCVFPEACILKGWIFTK